jgi:hypothetical protein
LWQRIFCISRPTSRRGIRGSLLSPDRAGRIAEINFLHFAIILFALSVASLIGFSLLTPPPPRDKVQNLAYQTVDTRVEEVERGAGDPNWRHKDATLSAIVLVVIAYLWWHFS